jgi:hypothetical protein
MTGTIRQTRRNQLAKTTFTDDELKLPMFFELVKRDDGPDRDRIDFHGFVTQEMILRARNARQSYSMVERYSRVTGLSIGESQHLMFLAMLFLEIEQQNGPMPDNPCAEVPLEARSFTNLREPPPFKHEGDWDPSKYKK